MRDAMINKIIGCLLVLSFVAVFTYTASAVTRPPSEGGILPEIVLPVPPILEQKKYLGLSGGTTFTIPQIKASIVIVEIFSMYCPYCQAEAPSLNKLYYKIQNDSRLEGRFKLIGIGAGNTTFEVDYFRNTYKIPFPLFPDDDFSIHKKIGEVRTPYFFAVRINKDGTHRILYSHPGRLKNHDQFIKMLLQRAELK
jgi:thiol-disulfide isomerase/thioredoxin